ncbi:MAG: GAF domain-containing sensor histidine kinase [Bacteroidota bacterium]|nr:ATPase [Christiangramia sp.]MEE2771561.1 GAF domain-containing sensor histidine kinase [Bacteroidota bacterium]|tara:strand:- start:140 stop:1357 length:1218 start_codon:yes stop_codon:yes gene_type:complete
MIVPKKPDNEDLRLTAVRKLELLDSLPEESYDSITALASHICDSPIALITLLDENRQWFKSKVGTNMEGSPRETSFCGHAILKPQEIMEVTDTTKDLRFIENPLVTDAATNIKFYAGVPILDTDGLPLGTLCVLDNKQKQLTDAQRTALRALGKQVELLYEYHNKNRALEQLKDDLNENNRILQEFASTVSHDLKMPLANMILTADIMKAKYGDRLDSDGLEYLNHLKQSGLTLSDYISGILDHYSSKNINEDYEEFHLNDLLEDIIDLLQIEDNCEINLPDSNLLIEGNSAALGQIFMNLISNSLKYNSSDKIIIDIDCTESREFFHFSIHDNGIGIPKDKQESIFNLFTIVADTDRQGRKGHGIGLSTVKKLVESMQGSISLDSEEGKGTLFKFTIKRPIPVH